METERLCSGGIPVARRERAPSARVHQLANCQILIVRLNAYVQGWMRGLTQLMGAVTSLKDPWQGLNGFPALNALKEMPGGY